MAAWLRLAIKAPACGQTNHKSNPYLINMATTANSTVVVVVVVLIVLAAVMIVGAQNCGCSSDLCCSKYGYCGTGDDYCGDGCKSGPCYASPTPGDGSGGGGGDGDVGSIVTEDVFGKMVAPGSGCEGNRFYSYSDFLDAAQAFSDFGTSGDDDVNRREIAAFFANAAHETGSFCFINEQDPKSNFCQPSEEYPCADGKDYHGRGPLQLSWNYNYIDAGKDLNFDGLNNPDVLATDAGTSWKASMWFWMKHSNCHSAMTSSGGGFGDTIEAINSNECGGRDPDNVANRVNYFNQFCQMLGASPGSNVSC